MPRGATRCRDGREVYYRGRDSQRGASGGSAAEYVRPSFGYSSVICHRQVGPRPSTFSGQRALDFVLGNRDLIDKTLLFNVKLVRVDPQ